MAKHIELGKKGEALARKLLLQKGYTILETNWRFEKDEIDIIALEGEELVVVEVKTRSSAYYGHPEEAVGTQKEGFLIRGAEAFLEERNMDREVRYDIVSVILNDREQQLHHIQDAFFPEQPI